MTVMKVRAKPVLFVTPGPLIVRETPVGGRTIKLRSAPSKIMLLTSVLTLGSACFNRVWAKVATSAGPLGTVGGDQFAGLFQSSFGGFSFQVALPASAPGLANNKNAPPKSRARMERRG